MIVTLVLCCALCQAPSAEPQPSPEVLRAMQAGADAESHNDLESAIVAFRKASELAPDSPVPLIRLGAAYMKKRHYADAIPPLKHAVQMSPDLPLAQRLLGVALLAAGYAAEAIPHLQKVHEDGALGIAQLQSGHTAEAVASLQAALAKNPDDPDLLFYLSRASTELASQSLDHLLATSPDSARGHQAKGQTYYQMKLYADAIREYEKALSSRDDHPGLRMELGEVFAATSQWSKAEEQFRAEAALQPGNAELAYRLGDVLLQQGKMKEAAEELKRSDALRPDMPETLYALGRAFTASNPQAAEQVFSRVIDLEKETPLAAQAYLALAGIHRKQGKTELAAREMQEFRRIQGSATSAPQGVP